MPQILKEDRRQSIIAAAKKELLTYGYRDASMRRIALRSHMTVGNLYRYFANKDELIQSIVSPTLSRIEKGIAALTQSDFCFGSDFSKMDFAHTNLSNLFDRIGDLLADIYESDREEMQILMMHSKLNESLGLYFADLLEHFGFKGLPSSLSLKKRKIMAKSVAVSIFSGVKECLKDNIKTEDLKTLLRLYFRIYADVLNLSRN